MANAFDTADFTQDFLASLDQLEGRNAIEEIRNSLPKINANRQDVRTLKRITELVKQIHEMEQQAGTEKWFDPNGKYPIDTLPKHKAFFEAGLVYPERLFMAGNRVGKSIAGCFELACHLTGEYPSWWNGVRFDTPIDAWAVGKDARAVRDTAQRELLGPIGEWGTGMIPAHCLGKFWALQGTPQAVDMIKIKHKSGGWSNLGFKNYQQDIGSFMGTTRHVVWLDEECPLEIYNECNIRTATVNGIMLVTFTPLDGLTPMVVNFCKRADFLVGAKPVVAVDTTGIDGEEDGDFIVGRDTPKAVVQAGWNDAPWLSEDMKARLLEDTPEYLRKARMEGLPAMGSGCVYPVNVEDILIDAIRIPDSWPRMFALDVGWNRTAVLWAALDPVTDTLYFYDEHYLGQEIPAVHAYAIKSRGEWIQGVFDPAARGRSPNDGRKLIQTYKDHGITLFPADNAVDAGIHNVSQRLVAGKLKVFKHLVNFQKEYLLYRRDKNGKIIKENDHLMDCLRYIVMNLIRMSSKSEQNINRGIKYVPNRYDV